MLDQIDYDFFIRLDEWGEQTIGRLLTADLDPDEVSVNHDLIGKRILIFRSSVDAGTLNPRRIEMNGVFEDVKYFAPLEVIKWAIEKRIPINQNLIDWFNEITKPIGNEPTLNNNQDIFISKELKILNEASKKWWSNADPEEKGTHTKQEIVEQWLINNGFSKNKAETGASIIRPEWAAKGNY